MNENNPATAQCSRCGAPVTPGALKGLCPRCLMELNLAPQTEVSGEDIGPGGTLVAKSPLPAAPSLEEIAKLFPHLEIVAFLGRGGMGAVYKARQPKLDRHVALKILLRRGQDGTTATAFAERFAREARALARLNHPDIVAVYDYGESGGYPYLVMEYVDGLTLRDLLRQGKLPAEQALAIVPKVCEALQFAHQQGIVHRDIKPENILLDKQGRVKIADFGIAKIVAPGAPDPALTGGKDVVGTPHYMAPEQVEQPAKVDHRADIFSLGVVFYEMLTGELPLGKFPPPSHRVQVDVRLDEVVLHALEKQPERRYQHASDVKSDVETIAATPGSARPGPSLSGATTPDPVYATQTVKGEFLGIGAAVQGIGLACFFLPKVGFILGIVLLVIGGRLALRRICSHCGNRTTKHARICPTCGAHFGPPGAGRSQQRPGSGTMDRVAKYEVLWLVFASACLLIPVFLTNNDWVLGGCLVAVAALLIAAWFQWTRLRYSSGQPGAGPKGGPWRSWRFWASSAVVLAVAALVWLAAPKHPNFSLSGTVTDSLTGTPLARATVAVSRSGQSHTVRQVRADAQGRYRLMWPQDADLLYWEGQVRHSVKLAFTASAPGYETAATVLPETRQIGDHRYQFNFMLQPTNGAASTSAAIAAPPLGPTLAATFDRERVVTLNDLDDRRGSDALDLDRGQTLALPKDLEGQPESEQVSWMLAQGADLFLDKVNDRWGLLTLSAHEVRLAPLPNERWNLLTEDTLSQALEKEPVDLEVKSSGPGRIYVLPANSAPPLTFAFRTADDGRGLLQITQLSTNPNSARIRIKKALPSGGAQAVSVPEPDYVAVHRMELGQQALDAARDFVEEHQWNMLSESGDQNRVLFKAEDGAGKSITFEEVVQGDGKARFTIRTEPGAELPAQRVGAAIWRRLGWAMPAALSTGSSSSVAVSFGPVMERTLAGEGDANQRFIDFDNGKLFAAAEFFGPKAEPSPEETRAWWQRTGIDAVADTAPGVRGLVGFDMIAASVPNEEWDKLPVARLDYYLTLSQPGTPAAMPAKGALPVTYVIKTREGRTGILQITALTTSPATVKIRYKVAPKAP